MRPSASARMAPMIQPNIASGPPIVATMAGIVTNGPMPHIWVMLIAVACSGPIWRSSAGCWGVVAPVDGELIAHLLRCSLLVKFLNILSASVREFVCKFWSRRGRGGGGGRPYGTAGGDPGEHARTQPAAGARPAARAR